MEYNNFNSGRCNICFYLRISKDNHLKLCANCKLVSYCSVEHQKLDWDSHKKFCKAIKLYLETKSKQNIYETDDEKSDILKCKQSVKKSMQEAVFFVTNYLKTPYLSPWQSLVSFYFGQ